MVKKSKLRSQKSKPQFKIKKFYFLIVVLSFAFCALRFKCYAESDSGNYVRVLIAKDTEKFNLYIKGHYEVSAKETGAPLLSADNLNADVFAEDRGIKFGNAFIGQDYIIISPEAGCFYINNRPLRGGLIIKKNKSAKLLLINRLEIEDYVKGVLFHEVSHHWPLEAINAQAVATRTYALYHSRINKDRDYDLTSDIYSQVYGGKDSERYRTNSAVERTKGLVLTYKGKIFPAYFHATCGGRTEDAEELWNINIAPLKGVACGFCAKSKHFKWRKVLSADEICARLNASGRKITSLKGIRILQRNRSGRVKTLKISSPQGNLVISGKDFRQIIGGTDIRSANFTLKLSDGKAYFDGFGWGHGVGLCQWGAYFAARGGLNFRQILKHYYSSAEISPVTRNP